jgi:DsbC/DsbD-like thiol-disulfide interchange protein
MLGGPEISMRVVAALTILTLCMAVKGAPRPDLVKAELLADVDAIQPGTPFHVGVLLKIKPEWHVYWKYPGDSGSPTRVEFKLPEGWKVGELEFPIPKRFDQASVIGYGYGDEVMLIATITPSSDVTSTEITANVKWLSCNADVCIPGKAELKSRSVNAELIKQWLERMPDRTGSALASTKLGTSPRLTASAKFKDPVKDIGWFPKPPTGLGMKDHKTETNGAETSMSFDLVPQQKGGEVMEFVVAYTDSQGQRRAAQFTLDLPAPPKP